MDERDYSSLRVFDGDNFAAWKFLMEIYFNAEKIMPIVNGTVPKPADDAPEAEKAAWQKSNNLARRMISSSVSLSVLENLVNCSTAACMWDTLCAIYQQKSKENIYTVNSKDRTNPL